MSNPRPITNTPKKPDQQNAPSYRVNQNSLNSRTNAHIYALYDGESNDEYLYENDRKSKRRKRRRRRNYNSGLNRFISSVYGVLFHDANAFERFIYFMFRVMVIAVSITVILMMFIFKIMVVSGDSMSPAVRNGDYIAVNKLDRLPAQGDIAVVVDQSEEASPTIKRIAARENQVVDIDYEKDVIYVDDKPFRTDLYKNIDITPLGDITFPVTVPEGCYFILGDNLANSLDSRSSSVGMVPAENILGTVILDYRPHSGISVTDDTFIDTPTEDIANNIWQSILNFINNVKNSF